MAAIPGSHKFRQPTVESLDVRWNFSKPALSVVLFLVVFAIFSASLPNAFINLDDPIYVTTNSTVQSGLRWAGLLWAFGGHAANWHPLTWFSHMLDCQLFGLGSWGHHLTNVLLHGANSVLLFLLLDRITGARGRSLFVAAIFALHPLHVESVAWVAERKDVLSTFFLMLTLLAYSISVQGSPASPAGARKFYVLSLFAFACGLMSKSMLVTTPFLLLLLDYWPLQRSPKTRLTRRRAWPLIREKIPFLALSAVCAAVTFIVQKKAGAVGSFTDFPLEARIENAFISYCRYLWKIFRPSDLAIYYPHPPGAWQIWQVISAILVVTGLCCVATLFRKRYPPAFAGWFWFVGTLVPVIGIVQVGTQTMADRYTYVPAIGVFILITWSVADFFRDWRHRTSILAVAGAAILVVCSILTVRQMGYWRNSETLFQHAIAAGQDCDFVELYLGTALSDLGQHEQALSHLERAKRLNREDGYIRLLLGIALDRAGRVDDALREVRDALKVSPTLAKAHFYLGLLLEKVGRPEEALAAYERTIQLNEDIQFVHYNLGILLDSMGRTDEAIAQFRAELRLNSRFPEGDNNLGKALFAENRLDEAAHEFRAALALRPNFPEVHNNLGGTLYSQGKTDEAIPHFREALRLKPDYEDARKNLETALAKGRAPGGK